MKKVIMLLFFVSLTAQGNVKKMDLLQQGVQQNTRMCRVVLVDGIDRYATGFLAEEDVEEIFKDQDKEAFLLDAFKSGIEEGGQQDGIVDTDFNEEAEKAEVAALVYRMEMKHDVDGVTVGKLCQPSLPAKTI